MTERLAPAAVRRRDASRTRQLLLDVARRRFAEDGYKDTTVRDIAADADVNVALISRYFGSKEGLFTACLTAAREDLRQADASSGELAEVVAGEIVGRGGEPGLHQVLRLLLRSSGDEAADRIRLGVLRGQSERLAGASRPGGAQDENLILRAQVVLGVATGVAALRTSGLEPLATAPSEDLVAILRTMIEALLPPGS